MLVLVVPGNGGTYIGGSLLLLRLQLQLARAEVNICTCRRQLGSLEVVPSSSSSSTLVEEVVDYYIAS